MQREEGRSSMASILAPGVGFVQTPVAGWFVLEETGQVCGAIIIFVFGNGIFSVNILIPLSLHDLWATPLR